MCDLYCNYHISDKFKIHSQILDHFNLKLFVYFYILIKIYSFSFDITEFEENLIVRIPIYIIFKIVFFFIEVLPEMVTILTFIVWHGVEWTKFTCRHTYKMNYRVATPFTTKITHYVTNYQILNIHKNRVFRLYNPPSIQFLSYFNFYYTSLI